jgi:hypothetical protein
MRKNAGPNVHGGPVMMDQAERFLRARKTKETFEAAILRANRWLASVLDSWDGEALRRAWGRDFAGLAASPVAAVHVVGPPAHFGEVAMLEAWLGKALPPSYRRFLQTVGQVSFLHRPRRPTFAVDAIKNATQSYRDMLDEWFEGYDQTGFGEEWARADRAARGYSSWRDWPNGSGVFRPDEVKDHCFVPICPGLEEDAHLLALHLADPSGEAPIFQNYPDDGAAFVLRATSFDAWMSSVVDDLITTAAPRAVLAAGR